MSKLRYRIGDLVKCQMGRHEVVARVIEDRGNIGHDGEQILRVEVISGTVPTVGRPSGLPAFELSASLVRPHVPVPAP